MLEILFLRFLKRKLGEIAAAKGRSSSWGWLGVGLWITGELIGFIIGAMAVEGLGSYLVALVCAGMGAGMAYVIISSLGRGEEGLTDGSDYAGAHALGDLPPPDLSNPYAAPTARRAARRPVEIR